MNKLNLADELELARRVENFEWGNPLFTEEWETKETFGNWSIVFHLRDVHPEPVSCTLTNTETGEEISFTSLSWHKLRWAAYQHILNREGRLRRVGSSWVDDMGNSWGVNRGKLISDGSYHNALRESVELSSN